MTDTNSTLIDIQWSMIAAKSGLKDLEADLFKLSQEKNFHLTYEDKLSIKDFIYTQKAILKAIETYID